MGPGSSCDRDSIGSLGLESLESSQWGLEPNKAEGFARRPAAFTESCRDVLGSGEAEQTDCQIAEGGERAGSGTLAGLAPILVVGYVADPVDSIFDSPVAA